MCLVNTVNLETWTIVNREGINLSFVKGQWGAVLQFSARYCIPKSGLIIIIFLKCFSNALLRVLYRSDRQTYSQKWNH